MQIDCPHCGKRPADEFTYLGDAAVRRPESQDFDALDPWSDYVFIRDNVKGIMHEYWHHAGGCGAWLVAERDTVTHEISSVVTASDFSRGARR